MKNASTTTDTSPRLYRVSVAARLLALPRSTLYRMISARLVASIRLPSPSGHPGGIVRIPASEVERLAAGRAAVPDQLVDPIDEGHDGA